MAQDILVFAHKQVIGAEDTSRKLVQKARQLSTELQARVHVLVLGSQVTDLAKSLGEADTIAVADSPALAEYSSDLYSSIVLARVAKVQPAFLLFIHDFVGMDLGPRVAAELGAGFVSNCTNIAIQGGKPIFLRTLFGGKIISEVALENSPLSVASIQDAELDSVETTSVANANTVTPESVAVPSIQSRTKLIDRAQPDAGDFDLTKADVIVAGGRGLGDKSNYQLIRNLAEALKGFPAASRPLIDMGWVPYAYQVGQSGKKVRPRLYVACGISGTIQHLVGMKDSKVIVAINNDATAPIFSYAHYGIQGDVKEVIPAMIEEVKKL